MSPSSSSSSSYNGNKYKLSNEHLRVYNDLMRRAAEEKQVVYLDLYAAFAVLIDAQLVDTQAEVDLAVLPQLQGFQEGVVLPVDGQGLLVFCGLLLLVLAAAALGHYIQSRRAAQPSAPVGWSGPFSPPA